MNGLLSNPDGAALAELPKADFHACLGSGGIELGAEARGDLLFTLRWDVTSGSWKLGAFHPDLFIDGSPAGFAGNYLGRRVVFQTSGIELVFTQELAAPKMGGKEANRMPISAGMCPIMIGRGGSEAAEQGRIALDPEARVISSKHLMLNVEDGSWKATNLGRSGTELNGALFSEAVLVYGDRLRIGPYLLEFRGESLIRIDHLETGKVQSRNVGVTVSDRETKQPKHILQGVNIDVEPGEFVGILGGSGQGKSTLLNALCGISSPSEGAVTIGGIPVMELISKRPGHVGFVPQDDIVHRELTIDEALRSSARLRVPLKGRELRKLIDRTIELLGLEEHRTKRIDKLSGGQRKRVSIAIELLSKPNVLFLDEPSSGLDPATEASLMRLLQKLALTRLTIICTTHVLQNAYLFNRLLFIHGGRLIFSGNTAEARSYFLSDGSVDSSRSDLEKIYPTVLDSTLTPEEWEARYIDYRQPPSAVAARQEESEGRLRVSAFKKLWILLVRQWHILRAERMNLAFLGLQVVVIGLVISWISEEPGFRMFLGLIAAMWFGCSNGAQQIVGELPIFFRERVCGLGNGTYLSSKIIFHGAVSVLQALVLFLVIIFASQAFYPNEWDSERFQEQLVERQKPVLADFSEPDGSGVFIPVGDDDMGLDLPEEDGAPAAEEPPPEEEEKPFASQLWLMEPIVRAFYLKENVLDSGPVPLTYEDGAPYSARTRSSGLHPAWVRGG